VVVIVKASTGELSATGYVLSKRDMIAGFTGSGAYLTYQVPVRLIGELTGLNFGRLPEFYPKERAGL
jgi:endonuclease G